MCRDVSKKSTAQLACVARRRLPMEREAPTPTGLEDGLEDRAYASVPLVVRTGASLASEKVSCTETATLTILCASH